MKTLKRFSAVIGAAALLALVFTGCNNEFAGTELNYDDFEKVKTGDQGVGVTAKNGSITLNTSSIKNSTRETISVTVNNATGTNTKVSASAADAINFYDAKDAEKDTYYYTHDSAALPKKLFAKTEYDTSTTFEFEVDASSVKTNTIIMIVDAKKCKDKQGTAILNTNQNDKSGEESDSVIKTISVGVKPGETALPAPKGVGVERYQPINLNSVLDSKSVEEKLTEATPADKKTGVFFVRINPKKYYQTVADFDEGTRKVNKELASKLNSAYKLRIRKPGSSSYDEKSLSFTYYTTYKNGSSEIISDETIGAYISQDIELAYGTYYELIETLIDVKDIVPEYLEVVYGLKPYTRTQGFGKKSHITDGTAATFTEQPTFIIDDYESSATDAVDTWVPADYNYSAITDAQKSYFDTISRDGTVFELYLEDNGTDDYQLAFASEPKDFLIIDTKTSNGKTIEYKLDFTVSYKKNSASVDDKLKYVRIEIKNKNISLNSPKLYIGSGVKLANNYAYPSQVSFGTYKDSAEGITSGYIPLN